MNTRILILLFLLILSLIIVIWYHNVTRPKIDLVIARYNENLEWFKNIKLQYFRTVFIYNKGSDIQNSDFLSNSKIKIIKLDNVGREGHTYLHHIIENYNNLADVTIFLPGSSDMENKIERARDTVNKTLNTNNSVFILGAPDVLSHQYNFSLTDYQSSNEENKTKNGEYKLYPCPERPFGKWFEHNFGTIKVYSVWNGIFSVSKKNIHNRSLEFYKKLIKYIDFHSNPEAGHYFERAWLAVFHPISVDCQYLYVN